MSGMSHAKQAAAQQERCTGILKSRRFWRGQRELKVAQGHSDRGFVGSVVHSNQTHKNCQTMPSEILAFVYGLHTTVSKTPLTSSTPKTKNKQISSMALCGKCWQVSSLRYTHYKYSITSTTHWTWTGKLRETAPVLLLSDSYGMECFLCLIRWFLEVPVSTKSEGGTYAIRIHFQVNKGIPCS